MHILRMQSMSFVYTTRISVNFFFFFFNDTATTEIYTLSLHDALPICGEHGGADRNRQAERRQRAPGQSARDGDRKSTRLNSSHLVISYAVFCLKKKKNNTKMIFLHRDEA